MADENTAPPPNFWQDDLLGRKDDANYLGNYLSSRYRASPERDKGFVLAVNADWGVGKTFLLKNWADELKFQKHAAVYFDAWANDFTPEPLVAFIAEIDNGLQAAFKEIPAAKKCLKDAVDVAKQLWKPAGQILLKALLKKSTGLSSAEISALLSQDDDEADEPVPETEEQVEEKKNDKEELKEALSEAFGSVLKEHDAKKKSISAFKEKLSLLISALSKTSNFQLPVFIFVDELDRCRPDYAIELLEGIKHLFGVPGIYFVVGTNLAQLGESTKAVYGPSFDGPQYLRRFFDLEYSLAEPTGQAFADALFKQVGFAPRVRFVTGFDVDSSVTFSDHPSTIFAMYAKACQLSLREQQRAMRNIEAVIATIGENAPIHIHYLCFLVMLQCKAMQDFEKMRLNNLTKSAQNVCIANALKMHLEMPDQIVLTGVPRKIPLMEIVAAYVSFEKLTINEIVEMRSREPYASSLVLMGILGRLGSEGQRKPASEKSSLADYYDLVRRAGQFG